MRASKREWREIGETLERETMGGNRARERKTEGCRGRYHLRAREDNARERCASEQNIRREGEIKIKGEREGGTL